MSLNGQFASIEAEHLVGASSVSSSYISHKNLPLTIEVSCQGIFFLSFDYSSFRIFKFLNLVLAVSHGHLLNYV